MPGNDLIAQSMIFGAGTIDFAVTMTGTLIVEQDLLALRNGNHGPTIGAPSGYCVKAETPALHQPDIWWTGISVDRPAHRR
ncbi:MAG: hypothetical protein AAF501_05440 [Pseudomonadota bacterium]